VLAVFSLPASLHSYNLNKAAEQNEYLSMSVVDRYVGVETATSYVRSPSSAKKRNMRMK